MEVPDQTSHHFQELTIDQILEQYIVQLPDETHQLVFEFLGLTTPPREHENTENTKDIRLRLPTSKDKQKTLRNIQRQWCQPALRKTILANIKNYNHRNLRPWDMPALYEEDTASDDKYAHQMTSHKGLKPHQYYNPTYPQTTMQSPILILTPNTKVKKEIWQRIPTAPAVPARSSGTFH
jgi:hypothetical protein